MYKTIYIYRASDRLRQKREILRHFQGKLCGKKGPLCGKLCDFFKAYLTLFYQASEGENHFLLSNRQLERKRTIKAPKINQLLPHFNCFNLKWVIQSLGNAYYYSSFTVQNCFYCFQVLCPPQTFEHDRSPCCTMSKTTCHLPREMYLADTSLSCRSQ